MCCDSLWCVVCSLVDGLCCWSLCDGVRRVSVVVSYYSLCVVLLLFVVRFGFVRCGLLVGVCWPLMFVMCSCLLFVVLVFV